MEADKSSLKYYADWAQPQGKTTKKGLRVHIHPYDLISYIHKKKGIEEAGQLAVQLIAKKYSKLLEESKARPAKG